MAPGISEGLGLVPYCRNPVRPPSKHVKVINCTGTGHDDIKVRTSICASDQIGGVLGHFDRLNDAEEDYCRKVVGCKRGRFRKEGKVK